MWMWKWRHRPWNVESKQRRRAFHIAVQHWKKGKCVHCGILQSEAPNHNCFTYDINPECAYVFIEALFGDGNLPHDYLD